MWGTRMFEEILSQKKKDLFRKSLSEEQKIDLFKEIIDKSSNIVFLGGAGVSTESGIPDFRSKDGLYRKTDKKFSRYRPEYLLSDQCLHRKPEVFFDYFRKNLDVRDVQPNAAHLIPQPAYSNAISLIQFADCLIIGGTSLEVGSAAGLAHSYHGKHLVIINKGKTKMEGKADIVFHDSIGKVLGMI